jgi:hypothetical protein
LTDPLCFLHFLQTKIGANDITDLVQPIGHAVVPHEINEVFSAVTSETGATIQKIIVDHFTHNFVWPHLKFFCKVDEDPDLVWNDNKHSLCQLTLTECNIRSENGDTQLEKRAWYSARKMIHHKITAMRNDKITALQKTFYGK